MLPIHRNGRKGEESAPKQKCPSAPRIIVKPSRTTYLGCAKHLSRRRCSVSHFCFKQLAFMCTKELRHFSKQVRQTTSCCLLAGTLPSVHANRIDPRPLVHVGVNASTNYLPVATIYNCLSARDKLPFEVYRDGN